MTCLDLFHNSNLFNQVPKCQRKSSISSLLLKQSLQNILRKMATKRFGQSLNQTSAIAKNSLGNVLYNLLKENIHRKCDSINYKDLLEQSVKLNQWIHIQSLRENDVILIVCGKGNEHLIPTLAAFFSHIIVAYVSSDFTLSQMKNALDLIKPKMIFCAKAILETFQKLMKQKVRLPKLVQFENIRSFIKDIKVDIFKFRPKENIILNQVAALIVSSEISNFIGVLLQSDYIAWINNSKCPGVIIPIMDYLKTVMVKTNFKMLWEEFKLKAHL